MRWRRGLRPDLLLSDKRGSRGGDHKCRPQAKGGTRMQDKTYVITEIVGVADNSIAEAVANAIARANKTLKALDWFEIKEVRGTVVNGKVGQYQVTSHDRFSHRADEERRAWIQVYTVLQTRTLDTQRAIIMQDKA